MNKLWLLTALCSTSLILGCSQNNDAGIVEQETAELQPTANSTLDNIPDSGVKVSDGPKFDLLTTPVGEIDFPNTCSTEAGVLVERGVALMHNMMYREAQFVFSMADDADPDCAMAYWGQAMTQIHPLWQDNLNAEEYARGLELTKKAQSIADTTQREKQYFKAAEVFYAGGPSQTMKEGYVNMSRIWDETSTSMPNDMDAKAFNALFKIAIAKSEDDREVAGQLALDILQEMSNHPGGHHYVIHAFDTANLAGKALTTGGPLRRNNPGCYPCLTYVDSYLYPAWQMEQGYKMERYLCGFCHRTMCRQRRSKQPLSACNGLFDVCTFAKRR
jgi:hypothetical protein